MSPCHISDCIIYIFHIGLCKKRQHSWFSITAFSFAPSDVYTNHSCKQMQSMRENIVPYICLIFSDNYNLTACQQFNFLLGYVYRTLFYNAHICLGALFKCAESTPNDYWYQRCLFANTSGFESADYQVTSMGTTHEAAYQLKNVLCVGTEVRTIVMSVQVCMLIGHFL